MNFTKQNFEGLGLDGVVFTAGKSGETPYGQIKKYYREQNGDGATHVKDTTKATANADEKFRYFYHPDHLGSSSYITDASGEVYQHFEYFPFGETFFEDRADHHRTPYLFNGKELDKETGLYYYGARYYDPRISTFYGVDLMSDKYPSLSPYNYTANNPLSFVDPDGNDVYGFDENTGQLSLVKETKDDFDRIKVGTFNDKGVFTANTGEKAASIDMSKWTLQGKFFDDISKSGLVFSEGKLAEGLKVMEFLSFKSNIEFSAWGYSSSTGYGLAVSPWCFNTSKSGKDFYLHSKRVGCLGDKLFTIHTHPGTKDNEPGFGYGNASAIRNKKGELIGGDAYSVRYNEAYPHYIKAAKNQGYSRYDKEGHTEYNVSIQFPIRKK